MPDDINNLDVHDEGLKAIFGDRFHDDSEPNPGESKKTTAKATKENPAKAVKAPAIETKYEPESKPPKWFPVKTEPDLFDRLAAGAKAALFFGGLSAIFFYWQQTGQMEASAALPSMLVCTALGGLNVGKNMKGRR